MKNITDLDVYNLAEELSDLIWELFNDWDIKTKRTIGYQIIKAADSISANIAEGYGRYTPADRKNFYYYSRGSFEETKCWLRKLIRRSILSPEHQMKITQIINALGPKLNSYINSTKNYKSS